MVLEGCQEGLLQPIDPKQLLGGVTEGMLIGFQRVVYVVSMWLRVGWSNTSEPGIDRVALRALLAGRTRP